MLSNFNSIKVQLEQHQTKSSASTWTFQFHKGTIRTLNSRLVTLWRALFQFHKGTIRTRVTWYVYYEVDKFQFHKGTIRTLEPRRYQQVLSHFNSIKVRLELATLRNENRPSLFQFHKGTIRTRVSGKDRTRCKIFQFHKGTIRTRMARSRYQAYHISIP